MDQTPLYLVRPCPIPIPFQTLFIRNAGTDFNTHPTQNLLHRHLNPTNLVRTSPLSTKVQERQLTSSHSP
jgi:hypothetical protein